MSEEYDDPRGGGQGYGGDGPNLRYDDFVGRIVRDPSDPPRVTLLSGYLGSSSEEGHVRLYLDEELSRYVEIPETVIRHTQGLPPEQSPLGGSLVWIDQGAEVLHGAAGSERRKATFLEGQIAQDYIGVTGGAGDINAAGGTTPQTRECGGGIGILPTETGPGCWQSAYSPCIPHTELPICRTRTGIFCTRLGPGCRRTTFEPACTHSGPNCRTAFSPGCQSVHYPCFTVNQPYCYESGFRGCTPIDFTIAQGQFGPQAGFAAGGAWGGEAAQFRAPFPPPPTSPADCPPVSRGPFACFTRFPFECEVGTVFGCPPTMVGCPPPTGFGPRCLISRVAVCGITRFAGCVVESAVCGVSHGCFPGGGFDPAGGGGGVAAQGFRAAPFAAQPPPDTVNFCAAAAVPPTRFCPSQFVVCPSAVDACPTRYNCPSQFTPCQSQLIRCPSALDACPTRFNCPSMTSPCVTQDFSCETRGQCPSAVDACPTRFGCYETQVCVTHVCQVSQACFPQGGGGFGGF